MKTYYRHRIQDRAPASMRGVVIVRVGLWLAAASVSFGATPSPPSSPAPTLAGQPEDRAVATELDEALGMATPSRDTYQIIVARNPFALRPPPEPEPPEPEEEEPEVSPSDLKLTGVTTLLGTKRAMFVLREKGKEEVVSDLVAEGQKDPFIPNLEVVQIDEIAGEVKVLLAGEPMTLDFVNNGIPPEVARPTAKPGARRVVKPGVRTVRTSTNPRSTASRTVARTYNRNSGLRNIPTRQTRTPPSISGANRFGQRSNVRQPSPVEQSLTMHAQQELARQAGVVLPPVPPAPGMPPAMQDAPPAP